MADQETLLERLIPGDLEHQIPAAVEKILPGGFKNRLVQIGLGLLLAFGLKAVVTRWIEARERARGILPFVPAPPALPQPAPRDSPSRAVAPLSARPATPAPSAGIKYPLLGQPHVHLSGPVDQAMVASFREQIAAAPAQGPLVVALSTTGGDADVARLMCDEIRLLREHSGREMVFLGRVAVYSAGAVFMAAFPADKRFVTRGTLIMIDARTMTGNVALAGPLKALAASLKAKLHEVEHMVRIEEEGLRELVAGSRISFDEVCQRAADSWYIDAEEARALGLVLDVI